MRREVASRGGFGAGHSARGPHRRADVARQLTFLLVLVFLAAPSLAEAGGRAPAKGWSGTIEYSVTGHMVLHEGRAVHDWHHTLTIEVDGRGPAHATASWFYQSNSLGSCEGVPHRRVDTAEGRYDGTASVSFRFGGAVAPKRLYEVIVVGVDIPTKTSSVHEGGCGNRRSDGTGRALLGQLLPVEGRVQVGLRLTGRKGYPVYGIDTCEGIAECRVEETLTWNLGPARTRLKITELELLDRDPFWSKGKTKGKEFTKLEYLSASKHPFYKYKGEGQTRIYGTIEIQGPDGDELESLELEVLENGKHVATAKQAPGVNFFPSERFQKDSIEAFDETILIREPRFLFRLPASQAAKIDQAKDAQLTLRVRAKSSSGAEATRDFGPVTKLVLYDGKNRYGGRDDDYGGDGWAQPSTLDAIRHFSSTNPDLLIGDIANMNGDRFWPHSSHGDGLNVDAFVDDYYGPACFDANAELGLPEETICLNELTALAATKLVGFLNDPVYGAKIEPIFVTYSTEWATRRQFADAIKDVTLADGRKAVDVIRVWEEHDTHFHFRFKK